jgi:hypothetical protein
MAIRREGPRYISRTRGLTAGVFVKGTIHYGNFHQMKAYRDEAYLGVETDVCFCYLPRRKRVDTPRDERIYVDHPDTRIPTYVGFIEYVEPYKNNEGQTFFRCKANSAFTDDTFTFWTRGAAVSLVEHYAFKGTVT